MGDVNLQTCQFNKQAAVSAFRWVQKKDRNKEAGSKRVSQVEEDSDTDEEEPEISARKEVHSGDENEDAEDIGANKLNELIRNARKLEEAKAAQEEAEVVKTSVPFTVMRWLKRHGKSVPSELSRKQKAELTECFNMIDADGSGAIDAEEMQKAFIFLGIKMSVKDIEIMFDEVDEDGSGEIEFPEFVEVMTSTMEKMNEGGGDGDAEEGEEEVQDRPLPFPLMAMAYRRRKLMEATFSDEDRKNVVVEAQKKKDLEDREAIENARREYEKLKKSKDHKLSFTSKLLRTMEEDQRKREALEAEKPKRTQIHYPGQPLSRAQYMSQYSDLMFSANDTMVPKNYSGGGTTSFGSYTHRSLSQSVRAKSCSPAQQLPPVNDQTPIQVLKTLRNLSPYARAALRAQEDARRRQSREDREEPVPHGLTPVRDLKPVRHPLSQRGTQSMDLTSTANSTPRYRIGVPILGSPHERDTDRGSPSPTLGRFKLRPGVSKAIHRASKDSGLPPLRPPNKGAPQTQRRTEKALKPRGWIPLPNPGCQTDRPSASESWTPRDLQLCNSQVFDPVADYQVKQLDFGQSPQDDPFHAWQTHRSEKSELFHPSNPNPKNTLLQRKKDNFTNKSSPVYDNSIRCSQISPTPPKRRPT